MRYIHWRDDFSITESFSTGQASAPVPQRVRIEYFTAKGHGRFVAERNGNTFVNCELSADGNSLVVHVSLRDRPIGHGRLLRIATVITEDANFPGGLKYSSIPDKVAAVLYFGKSDGPLDIASEIVFDGVDRLSLLEDVKLSGPDIGDLLSWNGADWVNIPRSAVAPDLSDYVRWTELPDYVTVSDLQDILADLITSDEITSLSQRITALEQVQFFELDGNGNVKLKDEYGGLWASGWIAAGGVGTGSGGGGGASALYDLVDVSVDGRKQGDLLTYNGSHWVNMERSSLLSDYYTKPQIDALISHIDLSGYVTKNDLTTAIGNINHLSSVTTNRDGTLDFNWKNGDTTQADLSHRHLDLEAAIASLRIWIDDGNGNLTLDPSRFTNVWIPGWLAAGGVGSSSGGGGGIDLDRVWQSLTNNTDKPNVEINIAHIPTLTAAKIPDITTAKVSDINTWITGKGLSIAGISVNIGGSITAAALKQALGISGDETPTISSVVLTNGANYSEITVDDTSASFYTKAQIDTTLDGYATESWVAQQGFASASDLSSLASRVTSVEDWFEIVTVDGQPAIHVKQGRALYSDSWISAGGVGSGSGGGGGTYVAWGTKSGNTRPLTVEGTTETLLLDGALSGYATESWVQSWVGQQGYVTSQALNTALAPYATNLALAGKQDKYPFTIIGASGATYDLANYVTLDTTQTITGAKTLSADLTVLSTAKIKLGPITLEYDSSENALHITSNDNSTVNLYCDGYIAAGGVQQSA